MPLVYPKSSKSAQISAVAAFLINRFGVSNPAIRAYPMDRAAVSNSETVTLNKLALIKGDDYSVDGSTLRITTQVPLEVDDVLVIHYMSLD